MLGRLPPPQPAVLAALPPPAPLSARPRPQAGAPELWRARPAAGEAAAGGRPGPWALQAVRADAPAEQLDTATLRLISDITSQVDDAHAGALRQCAEDATTFLDAGADNDLKRRVAATVQDVQQGLLERDTEVGRCRTVLTWQMLRCS